MEPISPKVTASAIGGGSGGTGLAIIILWILKHEFGYTDADFSTEFVAAVTGVLSGLSAFVAGWMKKHADF